MQTKTEPQRFMCTTCGKISTGHPTRDAINEFFICPKCGAQLPVGFSSAIVSLMDKHLPMETKQ